MRTRPFDVLLAMLIAAGFAAVGDVIRRRGSRDLADWNISLVSGMGVCAALFFPLSLLAPRRALDLTLFFMGGCAAWRIWRRARGGAARTPAAATSVARDPLPLLPLTLAAMAALSFIALDFRYNLLWDGFAAWASKGQRLFVDGGLSRSWYPGEAWDARYLAYPPLVPLFEALVGRVRGRFDFDGLKPIFVVFHLSLATSVFFAVRARASSRLAAWATAIVLLIPELSTSWAAGAYADMPQAAVAAAVVAGAMRRDGRALPLLIGALTTVKPEGLVLAGLASTAAAWSVWLAGADDRLRVLARAASVVIGFMALRIAYIRWTGVPEDVYRFDDLRLALSRVPEVARLCLPRLLDPRAWGLLWPAFAAAALILRKRGSAEERALAAAAAAGVAAMTVPFLFSIWPLAIHVEQAYARLLAQLAPAAVVSTVLGYARTGEPSRAQANA